MDTPKIVDINTLINYHEHLEVNILGNVPDNAIINGSCENFYIDCYYPYLDLSQASCKEVKIINVNEHEKMNIKLPTDMEKLVINNSIINMNIETDPILEIFEIFNCEIISLTGLPDKITDIKIQNSEFKSLIKLPKFTEILRFSNCDTKILPKLPKSLHKLILLENKNCHLDKFPKSLKYIDLYENNLKMLPKLPSNVELSFLQDSEIYPIGYNPTIKIIGDYDFKMKIKDYEPLIESQDDFNEYMNSMKRNARVKRA